MKNWENPRIFHKSLNSRSIYNGKKEAQQEEIFIQT